MKDYKVIDQEDKICKSCGPPFRIKPAEFLFKPTGSLISCFCEKCKTEYFAKIIEVPDPEEQGSGDTIEIDAFEWAKIFTSTGKGDDHD